MIDDEIKTYTDNKILTRIRKNQTIKTEAEYKATYVRILELTDEFHRTGDHDELDALTDATDTYEEKHYPMEAPKPLTAYEFCKREGWM